MARWKRKSKSWLSVCLILAFDADDRGVLSRGDELRRDMRGFGRRDQRKRCDSSRSLPVSVAAMDELDWAFRGGMWLLLSNWLDHG
jgi:hypothetical protein